MLFSKKEKVSRKREWQDKCWRARHRALLLQTGQTWVRKGADGGISLHTDVAAHRGLSVTVVLLSSAILSLRILPLHAALSGLLCIHCSWMNPDHLHHHHHRLCQGQPPC